MCLAWFKPATAAALTDGALTNACSRNPDGFGLAYAVDGVLTVAKFGPKDRSKFIAAYRAAESRGVDLIAHARFATHGSKTQANAHPFVYEDPAGFEVAVIHNGVIGIKPVGDMSDTETFVRLVLAPLPSRWWENPSLVFLVEQFLGHGNKVVLMTALGETVILNEKQGDWRDGAWLSNTYSVTPYTYTSLGYSPSTSVKALPASTGKPTGKTPANPQSRRSQKREARQAARAAKREARKVMLASHDRGDVLPMVKVDEPSIAVPTRGPLDATHGGHKVEFLRDVPRDRDEDLFESVECVDCGTIGDAFIIDGRAYIDMKHALPATAGLPF